jgi:MFS family permease
LRSDIVDPAPQPSRDAEVIGLVGLAHAASHFLQLLLPPLFPWLKGQFGLSFTEVGALMTALFVVSGVGQAAAGLVVDRLGARRVLCAGLAMIALSALLVAVARSYPTLMAAAILLGLGNSFFHPADFSLLNRHVSPGRLSHGFSAHGLTGYVGWAAAPVTVAGVAAMAGWRIAAVTAAAVPLLVLAAFVWRTRDLPDTVTPGEGRRATRDADHPFAYLGVAVIWVCFSFFLLSTVAASAIQNFAPTVLQVTHGLTLRTATLCVTLYMLGGAAGIVMGGFLAARGGAHAQRVATVLGAAAVVSTAVAIGLTPGWAVPPAIALIGFCTGMAGPSRDLLVRRASLERFGPSAYGRIYGFVYSGLDVGGAVAPLLFAGLLDRGLFRQVLFGVATMQVLALFTALNIGRNATAPAPVAERA